MLNGDETMFKALVLRSFARALWYLDPYHSKLNDRGIPFPVFPPSFKDTMIFVEEPRLSVSGLDEHVKVVLTFVFDKFIKFLAP